MIKIRRPKSRYILAGLLFLTIAAMGAYSLHYLLSDKDHKYSTGTGHNVNGCKIDPFMAPPFISKHLLKWHPDGKSIFFDYDTYAYSDQAIWKVNTDGTNLQKVAEPKQFKGKIKDGFHAYLGSAYGFDADLSPDGNAIVHSTCADDEKKLLHPPGAQPGTYDLAINKMDGSKPKVINNDGPQIWEEYRIQVHPAWSPDGNKIAFIEGSVVKDSTVMDPSIRVIQIDADHKPTENQPFTTNWQIHATTLNPPAWSPDATKLAFLTDNTFLKDDQVRIYELNPDDPNDSGITKIIIPAHILENGEERDRLIISAPVWSPDGSRIAYVTTGYTIIDTETGQLALHIANTDGEEIKRILIEQFQGSFPIPTQLAWHPDGTELLLMHRSLSSIDIQTNIYTVLMETIYSYSDNWPAGIAWSPDGTQFALKNEDECSIKILLMTKKGGNARTIAELRRPPIPGTEPRKDPCY